jgi:hypothetical protein
MLTINVAAEKSSTEEGESVSYDSVTRPPLQTIEFRQHAATLDVARIAAWVRVVCPLV